MYGLVMLTALSSGADVAPAPQPAPVVTGYGCGASCYGSCYGLGSGCYGSCHGFRQGHGLFGHHRASCHGCSGYSCSGWSCFGSSCHGCRGSACFGGGCFGGCWGPSPPMVPYSTGLGYAPAVNYADPWAVYGRVNPPSVVVVPATEPTKPMEIPVAPKPKEGMGANLKFRLPADAKLYVDGRLTLNSGTERTFTTPPLAEGSKYYYDVRAEVVVDGKAVVEEKRVVVEAGANVAESFPVLIAAVEGKTASVAGK